MASLFIGLILIFPVLLWFLIYMTKMPGNSYPGEFYPLSEKERILSDQLKSHVFKLAEDIGERNIRNYNALEASADYIEKIMTDMGLKTTSQEYKVQDKIVRNIEAEISGTTSPGRIFVIGAHYDTVPGSPGANDNASGIAAILEIARLLLNEKPGCTVKIVAFANEEPPFFRTKNMGSLVYAIQSHKKKEQIEGMISIETIGYYSEIKGSQKYPFPLNFFYPNTANFIGFVGNISSRQLVRKCIFSFRQNTPFPSEGVAALGLITGISWSDHWAFWKKGYSAIMITDTAFFRYGQYHTSEDTPEKIDYDRMARAVLGISHVIKELAGSPLICNN